jgi:pimeloyl-ACP methyl ester carboxylesterase
MPQDLKDAFLAVNPDEAQLRDMYEKDAERMRNFVETGDEQLRTIGVPTLVIAGDRDVLTLEHAVEISRLLPNARLIILPGTHGSFLGLDPNSAEYAPALSAQLVERFLDERY